MAIALCGQPLLGQPVMVKPSEAEKNLVQSTSVTSGESGLGTYSGGARRLYVGNLPVTIKEDQLRQVFEPFGAVELLQMPTDLGTGNCKGYAFIQIYKDSLEFNTDIVSDLRLQTKGGTGSGSRRMREDS